MNIHLNRPIKAIILPALVLLAAVGITLNWLHLTPEGLYEKGMAIGASVCHQLPTHSFIREGIQFPICARCSGLYLGCFISLLYYFIQGRRSGLPKRGFLILLLVFASAWAGDGVNSLLSDILSRPFLYTTSNYTRLVSGFGMGLVLFTVLMTLFNLTIWKNTEKTALLRNFWQIGAYTVLTICTGYLLINGSLETFQALAYISVLTVVVIITCLYTIFWVIILRKENTFERISTLFIYLAAGFASAMLQIILLSNFRNWILR